MSLEARLEWRSPIAAHIDRLVIDPTALQGDARLLAAGEDLHHTEEVSLDAARWCQPAGLALLELAAADVRPGLKPMVDRFYPRAAFSNRTPSSWMTPAFFTMNGCGNTTASLCPRRRRRTTKKTSTQTLSQ